ncbi:MAG TPA: NAD(P)/FAD-dependent oxidoreductase [Candidatus Methylacidiphilales bacterium]|jgi:pyruvate/2-oxoglutarate dehydrogenase complex dihydrolipoamide dehydrogenase (E3) component|nr:NAD(P)/FAD-dependent oxidoreductase [Candidatus Methylacidiphilales bacterium]
MPTPLPRPASGEPVARDWAGFKPASLEFDVAVIGGGSAGFAAARTASCLGARVVVIEGGSQVGGLCILRGCMPSKSLLESAHRWHDIRRAREFGLVAEAIEVDMECVQARKQHLIGGFAAYRRRQLRQGKFTMVRGLASFLDSQTLLVTRGRRQELLTASTFIVATGSVITRVPVPGLWEAGCLTSDTALDAEKIPKRLAVLGGGVIAVELGQFFARVGSKTTILQRSKRIVRNYDPDVSLELERAFKAEKIEVRTGVKLLEVSQKGKGKKIVFQCGRKRETLVVDEILYALGRAPALEGLGLEKAGVALAGGRLPVDERLASSAPHIFAAGDAVGPHEVVHIAIQQGEIAARNAVNHLRGGQGTPETIDYRLKALVTFTDPEIALVGLTETEAKARGIEFVSASYPFSDHGKAMIGGHEFGFVKLLAEKSRGEIIGAEIIGPRASDLIHELIAVMRYRGTAEELATMPHYHPTLAEIVTYPAEEIADQLAPHSIMEHPLKHF